jgi:hypothetical protein
MVGENSLLQQTVKRLDGFHPPVNPVRNSSGALNPAGIILKSNPAAEQRGIISNVVNIWIVTVKGL